MTSQKSQQQQYGGYPQQQHAQAEPMLSSQHRFGHLSSRVGRSLDSDVGYNEKTVPADGLPPYSVIDRSPRENSWQLPRATVAPMRHDLGRPLRSQDGLDSRFSPRVFPNAVLSPSTAPMTSSPRPPPLPPRNYQSEDYAPRRQQHDYYNMPPQPSYQSNASRVPYTTAQSAFQMTSQLHTTQRSPNASVRYASEVTSPSRHEMPLSPLSGAVNPADFKWQQQPQSAAVSNQRSTAANMNQRPNNLSYYGAHYAASMDNRPYGSDVSNMNATSPHSGGINMTSSSALNSSTQQKSQFYLDTVQSPPALRSLPLHHNHAAILPVTSPPSNTVSVPSNAAATFHSHGSFRPVVKVTSQSRAVDHLTSAQIKQQHVAVRHDSSMTSPHSSASSNVVTSSHGRNLSLSQHEGRKVQRRSLEVSSKHDVTEPQRRHQSDSSFRPVVSRQSSSSSGERIMTSSNLNAPPANKSPHQHPVSHPQLTAFAQIDSEDAGREKKQHNLSSFHLNASRSLRGTCLSLNFNSLLFKLETDE